MALTAPQRVALFKAIDAAYPDLGDFALQLAFAGRSLQDIAAPNMTRRQAYMAVLKTAEAQGWLTDLLEMLRADEAQAQNATLDAALDAGLAAVAAAPQPLVALPPSMVSHAAKAQADAHDDAVHSALQRMVDPLNPQTDDVALLQRRARLGWQVGRIEAFGSHQGTCFLVGPDLVLTNFHVMAPLTALTGAELRVRFDHYKDRDGIIHDGFAVPVAQDWRVLDSPPAPADFSQDPQTPADPTKLDYALVRLSEAAAERPVPKDFDGGSPARGFCPLVADAPQPPVGAFLTIVQHPQGAPRKSTPGKLLSYGPNRLRMRYDANTEAGSSGSPVLNGEGRLVALHHSGDPNFDLNAFNQGIPIGLIVADMIARGQPPWPGGLS